MVNLLKMDIKQLIKENRRMNNENFTQDTVLDIITNFPIDPLRNKVVITLNKEEIDGDLVLSDNVMSEVQYVIAGEVIYRDKVVKPGQKVLLDIKGMMKSVRREVNNQYEMVEQIELDPVQVDGQVFAIIDDRFIKAVDNR